MVNNTSAATGAGSSTSVVNTGTKRKATVSKTSACNQKAARYNTFVAGDGDAPGRNVVLIPTQNGFNGLEDDDSGDEMIVEKPAKIRIPPITIFSMSRQQVVDFLKKNNVGQYSLKNLRHAIHLYCASSVDFKKVRSKLTEENINSYSHDLNEEKHFRVALKGLHLMDTKDLSDELKQLDLNPVVIRTIKPKNPRFANDVLYILSFQPGTIKLRDLSQRRVICHTIVQ